MSPLTSEDSRMNPLFASLARVVVRYRYLVVATWIAMAATASLWLPSMSGEINNNNSQFLPSSVPSERALVLGAPLFGSSGNHSQVLVVASTSSGSLDANDQRALAGLASRLRRVTGVTGANETAMAPNAKAAELTIFVRASQGNIAGQKTVLGRITKVLGATVVPKGLQYHLAGPVATNVANQNSSVKTGAKVQALSVLFIVVLLLITFRAPLAALITLLPPGFALVVSMRFIGGLGADGLQISGITELLLIVLLLGAGTDYGLFLVFRVREAIRAGSDPRDAVSYALARVGESITASAGTVIVALLTLLLATFGMYRDLGAPMALGMAVMLFAGLTLLPALLAIAGNAAFWPARALQGETRDGEGTRRGWDRVATRVLRRPAVSLAIGVAVFLGLASAALGYHANGFGGTATAPKGSEAAIGDAILVHDFPKASANPANLVMRYATPAWEDPNELVIAQHALAASGRFKTLQGPLDPNGTAFSPARYASLRRRLGNPRDLPALEPAGVSIPVKIYNAYRASALFVGPGGHTVQFEASLRVGAQQTTAAMNATPRIRRVLAEAARRSGATAHGLAGEAATLYDVNSTSNHDLVHIVPIAILAIAGLLALVLRSLVAPVYLVLSVGLSYLGAVGLSTLVFVDIGGSGGLTFILPFLMFIFLLALGEDYNILMMTRIREEVHRLDLRQAVTKAVIRTGPAITSAGIILAGTFMTLVAASSGPGSSQVRDIGFGLAFGILMDTFVIRTILVPSAVALLGRFNWWPSRLGRLAGSRNGGSR